MKKKKVVIKAGEIAAIIAGCFLLIEALGSLAVNYTLLHGRIFEEAMDAVPEELVAYIHIDDYRVNLLSQSASIYGIRVKDQQQRDMLQVESVKAEIAFWPLLKGQVVLSAGEIDQLKALIVKPSKEEEANYQFIIDAFRKEAAKRKRKKGKDTSSSNRFHIDLRSAELSEADLRYNDYAIHLKRAKYIHKPQIGLHIAILEDGLASWEATTKKGKTTHQVDFGTVMASMKRDGTKQLNLRDFRYRSDNHLPRKNHDRPKRGFFDVGHLDVTSSMDFLINHVSKDSLNLTLTRGTAKDSITGFNLVKMNMHIAANKQKISVKDVFLKQTNTVIKVPSGEITLPNKEKGTRLRYAAPEVTGKTILQDIARPFAPVLRKFTIPLRFRTRLSGTDEAMEFRRIRVMTDDNKFNVAGTGLLRDMNDKEKMTLHFDISDMTAKPGIKDKIINQFAGKKFMMRQLYTLGTLRYHGSFDIIYRKELFRGFLNTEVGNIDFHFGIDENTKYLSGAVKTSDVNLGELVEIEELGTIDCEASFEFDLSKARTAEVRKKVGGKLPIGKVSASINDCTYLTTHIRDLHANIVSDGALAQGDAELRGDHTALVVNFSFTNTEQMRKMKIKPSLKFYQMTKGAAQPAP